MAVNSIIQKSLDSLPITESLPKGISWDQLRLEFFVKNLNPQGKKLLTLHALAKTHGLNYGSLRNVACKGKWTVELRRLLKEKQELADQFIQNLQVEQEVEVRTRQAQFARMAQNKAILKLSMIDPKNLTVKEATELLKLGLQEERRALGLEEDYTAPPPSSIRSSQTQEAISKAMGIIQNLKGRIVEGSIDADPTP
jgi:hypothetical protein